jgi:hypothetical protein
MLPFILPQVWYALVNHRLIAEKVNRAGNNSHFCGFSDCFTGHGRGAPEK